MTIPQFKLTESNASRKLARAYVDSLRNANSPRLLLALPPLWMNRAHALWYSRAGVHGYNIYGIVDTSTLEAISWPGPIILHCHWFSFINNAPDEYAAERMLHETMRQVEDFRQRTGAILLWTAHNVYPHIMKYPRLFHELRRWIFTSFDAVHLLHDTHRALLEKTYGAPAPATFTVPVALYSGAYPEGAQQDVARERFDMPEDAFVFGLFGSIQPYKGIRNLLDSIKNLKTKVSRPICALIAGQPTDARYACELKSEYGEDPHIRLIFRKFDDYEVQYIYAAADAMVLPYEEALNSGAAFLAATYGKTFIMPKGQVSEPLHGLGLIEYKADEKNGLENCMLQVVNGQKGEIKPEILQRHEANALSERFFKSLDEIIERKRQD